MAKWKVGPWMPAELHARLVTGLGARDGDTIIVDGDGRVGLGRTASVDLSEEITSLLPRCPLVGQFPLTVNPAATLPLPYPLQEGASHLRLER